MEYDIKTKEDRIGRFKKEALTLVEIIFYSLVITYFGLHLVNYLLR